MTDNARKPWHGVLVATAMPWRDDDSPDLEAYGRHVAWLASNGCHGVACNGSLGEYQQLTNEQRDAVVRAAVAAAPEGFTVMPGVGAYAPAQSLRHAQVAADAGAQVLMLLPPNAYHAKESDIIDHYRTVAKAGLPICAYNNPFDTKVDLKPALLAKLFQEGLIVAVKEFACDVRRFYEIGELAPELDVLAGTDDLVFEFVVAGSPGWIAGYPNAFPAACVELFEASRAGDLERALPLYRRLHPLLRWDSKPEFIQAIKLSMDIVGNGIRGGRTLPPRGPLSPSDADRVREATEKALAAGLG